ncbi:hypothetical protein POX_c04307 [Penicillium oxalicum]|uniref:RING-type domain-containing protein n=1 Tax=Penicillium oxalicum (strain 114-2 / CGMCC 5302) TaxID=933388 RepID=S8AJI2_PENO1|nr:hypothetical protein POX_c04307 [Penicillium oxalicum]EPS25933.1 hypothetical protein PDE_00869 [Penicillium oxalicum 114-2]KAI2791446.1 hypothetical protein POX_c04307 [Penicillium oxalicum]
MQKTEVTHGPLSAKDMKNLHMPCYLGCEYLNIDVILPQTCDLCLEDMDAFSMFRRLPCSHIFHGPCVDLWLTTRDASCPLCRRTFYHLRGTKSSRKPPKHSSRAGQNNSNGPVFEKGFLPRWMRRRLLAG